MSTETMSIIVYRNPIEQQFYEGGGVQIFAAFVLCSIIAVCIWYWITEKLPYIIGAVAAKFVNKEKYNPRDLPMVPRHIGNKVKRWLESKAAACLIIIEVAVLYSAHLYFN